MKLRSAYGRRIDAGCTVIHTDNDFGLYIWGKVLSRFFMKKKTMDDIVFNRVVSFLFVMIEMNKAKTAAKQLNTAIHKAGSMFLPSHLDYTRFKCVSLKSVGYFKPNPNKRSIPIWAVQMRPTSKMNGCEDRKPKTVTGMEIVYV